MKKFRKYMMLILLGATLFFASCNRPIPFEKEGWIRSGGFDGRHFIPDDLFVTGNTRYRMALWLEKNYDFCNKSLNEILNKFYIVPEYFLLGDSRTLEQVKNDKVLRVVKRQRKSFWIEPWIDIKWIEIYFDDNFMVSRVYYVHRNHRTGERTERRICPAVGGAVPHSAPTKTQNQKTNN